ncbi:unnamed protein product [Oppiella nova]|uniref:Synaptic plasticity regulator PANTS n=1 Tax=Oppiella nova TaxID=334625 RepID=A0A7R9QDF5_9ACAR|nr:unnamed protein product [Oppiella nova]CAG2162818.1 unnamed protein product [Oppiella nova]
MVCLSVYNSCTTSSMSSSDDLPETEINFDESTRHLGSNSWLVRPCERYGQQYKDCKSMRARVHQYFIFGHSIDCSQWSQDYENCLKFRNSKKAEDLDKVIESEMRRKEERLETMKANDVWEYRSEPPTDWRKPLPDWFVQRNQFSLLSRKQKERQNNTNVNKT